MNKEKLKKKILTVHPDHLEKVRQALGMTKDSFVHVAEKLESTVETAEEFRAKLLQLQSQIQKEKEINKARQNEYRNSKHNNKNPRHTPKRKKRR